ncbi:hypothetical protein VT06_14730 [Arsukibacterium sp. MJ3]|nr:EpsG family protein [Arsukibacterium sp. MJ3]KKO47845.1 hypothetical protein VT06_14730 [Arsukibacterium sp. MJ3]
MILIFITGTRWFSDADFEGYFYIYQEVPLLESFNIESTRHIYGEIGYLFFVSLFKTLGLHFTVFVFSASVTSILLKYYFLSRFNLGYFAFSIYLLISFVSVEFIELRWSVSISFILLAYYYGLFHKRILLVLIFFIFSLMFHYYSVLFIALFFLLLVVRSSYFYFVAFYISLLAAFYIYINGFNFNANVDSDLYLIERFFRYLNDPDSKVGLFSILKVLYFLSFYHFMSWLGKSILFSATERIALFAFLLIYSVALCFSFVPVFYFRASAVGDLFGLVMIFIASGRIKNVSKRILLLFVFSIPFLLWFLIDISNSFDSERIFNYSSSIELII